MRGSRCDFAVRDAEVGHLVSSLIRDDDPASLKALASVLFSQYLYRREWRLRRARHALNSGHRQHEGDILGSRRCLARSNFMSG